MMKILANLTGNKAKRLLKALFPVAVVALLMLTWGDAFAADGDTGEYGLGKMAKRVADVLPQVTLLIMGISYVAGIGFAVAGIIKFKQHKDNPAQVPLGGPIAMIFIAAALIYLPTIIKSTGKTLSEEETMGAPTGVEVWNQDE